MKIEINKLIGETTDYDKKQELEIRKPKSWCKSISAFANGRVGSLIVTVEPRDMTPYYYIGDGQQITFYRMGNESIPANAGMKIKSRRRITTTSCLLFSILIMG